MVSPWWNEFLPSKRPIPPPYVSRSFSKQKKIKNWYFSTAILVELLSGGTWNYSVSWICRSLDWTSLVCRSLWNRLFRHEFGHVSIIEVELLQRHWRCIGHTLRKPASSTTRHAPSFWNPQGKSEATQTKTHLAPWPGGRREGDWSYIWGQLEELAQNQEPLFAAFTQSMGLKTIVSIDVVSMLTG